MPISNDLINQNKNELRQKLHDALASANPEEIINAMMSLGEDIEQRVRKEYEEMGQERDEQVLAARGKRLLTAEEKTFYKSFSDVMKLKDPQQALSNGDLTLPTTVIDAVFDELQTSHPLLSRINFRPSRGATEIMMALNPYQMATWGEICAAAVTEISAGFVKVKTGEFSLTAYVPVCYTLVELGPVWIDEFVRQVLYEALSNGLEYAIIDGTGNNMPIGMTRQVGSTVSVTGGVYPQKTPVAITNFTPSTVGPLLSQLALDPSGKPRQVRDVIMVVNPVDYYSRVFPATTVQSMDGTYRRDVLPAPMEVIQSAAVPIGRAVLGLGYRYLATVGQNTGPEGRIRYSDHALFLQRQRLYLAELLANGYPMDNNAFMYLDITGLTPAVIPTQAVTPSAIPNADDTLKALTIGSSALTPVFNPITGLYSAETSNASDTVTATANNSGATVSISNNGTPVTSGTSASWTEGVNTLSVTVTAANGINSRTYTVQVTYTPGD